MAEGEPTTSAPPGELTADTMFEDFYLATLKPLTAFVLMHGAALRDAGEIAHDTLADAFRCWDRIDHPKAWAYRVASKTFGRRRFAVREELVAEPPEPAPPLRACAIENWEQQQDLLAVLAELPERQRQVMAWSLSGFQPAEIAVELGIAAGAVSSSLTNARRRLAELMRDEGGSR